jgi:OmpR-family two-component system manganese-sensing response regulator
MPKLLLVDDDVELVRSLSRWLQTENYTVDAAYSGEDALQLVNASGYDLIVLDWHMPGLTGLEVCRRIRKAGNPTPVLFLTAQGDVANKESGLDSGADDYLCKPFDLRELGARMRSLLRRSTKLVPNEPEIAGVRLEVATTTVVCGDKRLRITKRECALLDFLMRHPGRPFSARDLRDAVWPASGEATDEAVRTCMKTLRQKLNDGGRGDLIKTIAGAGYLIEAS